MLLQLTTDRHETSRDLFATAELLVISRVDTAAVRLLSCSDIINPVNTTRSVCSGVLVVAKRVLSSTQMAAAQSALIQPAFDVVEYEYTHIH